MKSSAIDFSAQFGGSDAADSILPHFWALKRAAKEVKLPRFAFPELAFILRVDGGVHSFGLSGAGHLEIDRAGEYLSIDIGITQSDRPQASQAVKAALLASIDLIRDHKKALTWNIDYDSLKDSLTELCRRYDTELEKPPPPKPSSKK